MTIKTKIMFPIVFGVCASMFAQDANVRAKIMKDYDLVVSKDLVEEFTTSNTDSKDVAFKIAKEKNLPVSGITPDGRYYELVGVLPGGDLKYLTTYNLGSRTTSRVNSISSGGSLGLNLNGENMLIGILEGTIALDTHIEFTDESGDSRVIRGENFAPIQSYLNQLGNYEFMKFHATHVTGTLIAKGLNPEVKGFAPKAKVKMFNWNNDVAKMTTEASKGMLVSNHSYGINIIGYDQNGNPFLQINKGNFGLYAPESVEFDKLTYNHQYYQPVMAAGNDRGWATQANPTKKGNDMLVGKAVAKNTVVVAAVKEVLNYTAATDVVMTEYSNFGPADDFRIKPDIATKGDAVFSTAYELPKPPKTIYEEAENNLYGLNDGTSMASPAATAVFALWQQWAIENREDGVPFKSATLRALMAHTADEAGNAPGPDHMFGWGLLNAQKGVEVMLNSKEKGASLIEEKTLNNQEKYEKRLVVGNDVKKIIATLAWTDPAGTFHMSNYESENNIIPAIVNDLDIVLTKGEEEFLPWKLNKDFNDLRAVKGNNDVDNIEKIEIENVIPGDYLLRISHKGNLTSNKQDYTLIVSYEKADGTLSTENKELVVDNFKIWPNPVNNVLNIALPDTFGFDKVSYTVYDLSGKIVVKGAEQTSDAVEVSTTQLSKGVYFIEIESNGVKSTQKFVKK